MTVGERIRDLRLKKHLTPTQLAAAAGMTDGGIHQLEQGLSKKPSFENGLRLARALGVSPYFLAFGEEQDAPDDLLALIAALTERVEALEDQRRHRAD